MILQHGSKYSHTNTHTYLLVFIFESVWCCIVKFSDVLNSMLIRKIHNQKYSSHIPAAVNPCSVLSPFKITHNRSKGSFSLLFCQRHSEWQLIATICSSPENIMYFVEVENEWKTKNITIVNHFKGILFWICIFNSMSIKMWMT